MLLLSILNKTATTINLTQWVLQAVKHRLHVVLKLIGILVVDGLLLVVGAGVVENLENVVAEVVLRAVSTFVKFLQNFLKI